MELQNDSKNPNERDNWCNEWCRKTTLNNYYYWSPKGEIGCVLLPGRGQTTIFSRIKTQKKNYCEKFVDVCVDMVWYGTIP